MNTNILIRSHPEGSKSLTRKDLLWNVPNIRDLIHHGICWGYWQTSEDAVRDVSRNKVSSFHLKSSGGTQIWGLEWMSSHYLWRRKTPSGWIWSYWAFHLTQPLVKIFRRKNGDCILFTSNGHRKKVCQKGGKDWKLSPGSLISQKWETLMSSLPMGF